MNTYRQTHTAKQTSSRLLNRLSSANKRPPRYKLFLLTWLAIYPLITVILHFLGKYLNLFPLPLRTLLLTGVLVYLMTYWVMPILMKIFHSWLYPKSRKI